MYKLVFVVFIAFVTVAHAGIPSSRPRFRVEDQHIIGPDHFARLKVRLTRAQVQDQLLGNERVSVAHLFIREGGGKEFDKLLKNSLFCPDGCPDIGDSFEEFSYINENLKVLLVEMGEQPEWSEEILFTWVEQIYAAIHEENTEVALSSLEETLTVVQSQKWQMKDETQELRTSLKGLEEEKKVLDLLGSLGAVLGKQYVDVIRRVENDIRDREGALKLQKEMMKMGRYWLRFLLDLKENLAAELPYHLQNLPSHTTENLEGGVSVDTLVEAAQTPSAQSSVPDHLVRSFRAFKKLETDLATFKALERSIRQLLNQDGGATAIEVPKQAQAASASADAMDSLGDGSVPINLGKRIKQKTRGPSEPKQQTHADLSLEKPDPSPQKEFEVVWDQRRGSKIEQKNALAARGLAELLNDLKVHGPFLAEWPNYSPIGKRYFHCHLRYAFDWVAVWSFDKSTSTIHLMHVGPRDDGYKHILGDIKKPS